MYCVKKVTDEVFWVGGSDRRLALFENVFPIPRGVSYNSYLLLDDKTVLFDAVDRSVGVQYMENVAHVLAGRKLDYLVIHHMEPDHCATVMDILRAYPGVRVVGSQKTMQLIAQFYGLDLGEQALVVKEGDALTTGVHTLRFVMAPMVHWPEVMVTFDEEDGTLYSADAFGTFGARRQSFCRRVEF